MSDPLDLTGHWDGIFSYPRLLPPNGFACELRDHAGRFSGETHERDDVRDGGETILALLEGVREGRTVRFRKHYDDPARAADVVLYEGTLSTDGDEINGRWDIPGHWSGGFLMVRRPRRGVGADQTVAETVG